MRFVGRLNLSSEEILIAIFQANEARGGDGRCYGEGGGWQARGEVGRHQARLTLEELMFQGTNVPGNQCPESLCPRGS